MFDTRCKFTRIGHTTTATFLMAAFLFSLPVSAVSLPFGAAFFSLAMACMTVSGARHSQLRETIGTVE